MYKSSSFVHCVDGGSPRRCAEFIQGVACRGSFVKEWNLKVNGDSGVMPRDKPMTKGGSVEILQDDPECVVKI